MTVLTFKDSEVIEKEVGRVKYFEKDFRLNRLKSLPLSYG